MSSRYYDADGYPVRPNGLLKILASLCVIALAFVAVVTQWDTIRAHIPAGAPTIVFATQAPAGTAPRPTQPIAPPPQTGAATGGRSIGDYNATATAQWNALNPAPVPNTDATGDSAPLTHGSKSVPDRVPAGANVSIAEPTPPPADGQHGSKSIDAKPINIQQTHTCLHGQVWTATGCHRPQP